MAGLRRDIDAEGLLEYSVVFTDRSLNHMSKVFQGVMNDVSSTLKDVYGADAVVVVPGGGTYAMEAVARQFAERTKSLVVRNGWFSFRWSQIIDAGKLNDDTTVMKARQTGNDVTSPFAPAPIEEVEAAIAEQSPDIVFAPHVETSSGMMLPDEYVRRMGAAARAAGALFVLDCIASGTVWLDMKANNVDVLISAPQKGWSASPAAGLVMMGERAMARCEETMSSSFACDLKKWWQIMQAYENGGHAYHATMPTDALRGFRDVMLETRDYGFDRVRAEQLELGHKVRALLAERGFKSVAAPGFEAPGVVVCYTDDPDIQNGKKFAAQGLQIAAGVPLQCDEPQGFSTFRLGLFGLDKLHNVDRTVASLAEALDKVTATA